jgi:hypothetical protein
LKHRHQHRLRWIDAAEGYPRLLDDTQSVSVGQASLILEEDRVAGHGLLAASQIFVGDTREASAEAQVGEQRVRAIDEVFLQYILLVLVSRSAVRHELDAAVSREWRVLACPTSYGHPKRREAAHRRPPAKNPAGAQLDGNAVGGSVGAGISRDSTVLAPIFAAVAQQQAKIRTDGQVQRRVRVEH